MARSAHERYAMPIENEHKSISFVKMICNIKEFAVKYDFSHAELSELLSVRTGQCNSEREMSNYSLDLLMCTQFHSNVC